MGRPRVADVDNYTGQSQSCGHLSTPRSQGYLGAVARAKDAHHQRYHAVCAEMSSRLQEKRNININTHSLLLLAFDANVKEPYAHTAIIWAVEHALNRGDTLVIVVVCASVRGPFGYRIKISDEKWQSAKRALLKFEIQQKVELWTASPGLQDRCVRGGMELLLAVKAAQRPEVAIVREAVALGATHVILGKSWKNRRREFYVENLSCRVTRMRQSRGVEVVQVAKVVESSLQRKRTSTSRSAPPTTTSSTQSRLSSDVTKPVTSTEDDDLFSIGSDTKYHHHDVLLA